MKKQTIAAALAAALVGSAFLGTGMQTEAAQWVQDGTGWWYQEDNGSYPAGTWSYINDAWYYFDGSGYMLTGWQWIGGTWYYLHSNGTMAANQWVGNYYLTDSGAMAVNQWIGNYYVGSDGAWIPGYGSQWIQDSNGWWYRHSDGGYVTNGWENIGGTWYYFDGAGYMLTGWQWIDNSWYYLHPNGSMAVNQWIGDYYLTANGSMAVSQWIGGYYVGADGCWVRQTFGELFGGQSKDFIFSSGAGAWRTEMTVYQDGTFTGVYSDSDMGSTGYGYPNGTRYYSEFSGRFVNLEKVNSNTYLAYLEDYQCTHEVGDVWYENGIRYIATEPYGIDGGHPFYFYLPGSNIDSLPEGYRMWLLGSSYNNYETLPVFGIYNLNMELGFYGV